MKNKQDRYIKNWAQYVAEMLELDRFVNDDLAEAVELFKFATPDFCARTFVRTMAAEFETRLYLLQDFMLKIHDETANIKFSSEELAILKSESYGLRSNGDVWVSTRFYPFKEHLLFTLRLFARRFNPKAEPDTSGAGWQSVQRFVEIRNRLMHPKSMRDLQITDEEIDSINEAQDWLRSSFKSLFAAQLSERTKNPKLPIKRRSGSVRKRF